MRFVFLALQLGLRLPPDRPSRDRLCLWLFVLYSDPPKRGLEPRQFIGMLGVHQRVLLIVTPQRVHERRPSTFD